MTAKIIATNTPILDGFTVSKYIGVEVVHLIIDTALLIDGTVDIGNLAVLKPKGFETKLQESTKLAVIKLKYLTAQQGGNAVLSISTSYNCLENFRMVLTVCGTAVHVEEVA